jgi:hypothetical protein
MTFAPPLDGSPGFVLGADQADKPWIAVDNYSGQGNGNVYLAWTDFSASGAEKGIFFTRSSDDGLTWGPNGGLPIKTPDPSTGFQGAYVTVGPDHAVYVFWWDATKAHRILMRRSIDQGQTFGDPVVMSGLRTHGGIGDLGLTDSSGATFRTNALPQAAVNPVTGDIYVVYDDQPNVAHDKADIFFTESTDGGNTWSQPLRVNDDAATNDQWQPAIAVTPDGSHLGIFWYDRRLDPADNLIDHYGAIGTISGHAVSFAPNFRITDVSFPPAFDQDALWIAASASSYMGDYDMATADNTFFYTTWGDNRQSDAFFSNQPDVRFARIPIGETGDAATSLTRLAAGTINSVASTSSLDPTLFLPINISVIPETVTDFTRGQQSHIATADSVGQALVSFAPQTPTAPSLIQALDLLSAGASPAPADSIPWEGADKRVDLIAE